MLDIGSLKPRSVGYPTTYTHFIQEIALKLFFRWYCILHKYLLAKDSIVDCRISVTANQKDSLCKLKLSKVMTLTFTSEEQL